ncbi:MAG TPA: hypothetical protein VL856_18000 [Acidimicrobiia bacterium]|jgi:hypothetical protein|nr:hypothetical protein [Acidimicrobiia bacterium]
MRTKKRWLLGAISGFFFGLFLGLTLLGFGVYALDNVALTSLPIIFLVVGVLGALWGPLGRKKATAAPVPGPPDYSSFVSAPAPAPPPPPVGEPTPPPPTAPTLQNIAEGDTPPEQPAE